MSQSSAIRPLIEVGEELAGRAAKLAANYHKDKGFEENKGPVELWIPAGEHFGWFSRARAYIAQRFGNPSQELSEWDAIAKDGNSSRGMDLAQYDDNPYQLSLILYRNSTSYLKTLPLEPTAAGESQAASPGAESAAKESWFEAQANNVRGGLRYLYRTVGPVGAGAIFILAVTWLVITNAKEVRDGLEALGLLNLSGRQN